MFYRVELGSRARTIAPDLQTCPRSRCAVLHERPTLWHKSVTREAFMLADWKTTALGLAVATLGAFAAVDHWQTLSPKDAALALGGCFLYAIKGYLTADKPKQ